jgi:hypothetical protein
MGITLRNHWATSRNAADSIPDVVIGIFHSLNTSGIDSAFNKNQHQEYFLGVKAAGA